MRLIFLVLLFAIVSCNPAAYSNQESPQNILAYSPRSVYLGPYESGDYGKKTITITAHCSHPITIKSIIVDQSSDSRNDFIMFFADIPFTVTDGETFPIIIYFGGVAGGTYATKIIIVSDSQNPKIIIPISAFIYEPNFVMS